MLESTAEQWISIVIGAWLIVSPWILGFSDRCSLKWSSILSGTVLVLIGTWTLFEKHEATKYKIKTMAKVTIYSTPTCVYCKMAKDFFVKNNVSYEEHDAAADVVARKEMFDKTHQMGVPVITIDDKTIVGFDKGTLEEALGLAK